MTDDGRGVREASAVAEGCWKIVVEDDLLLDDIGSFSSCPPAARQC